MNIFRHRYISLPLSLSLSLYIYIYIYICLCKYNALFSNLGPAGPPYGGPHGPLVGAPHGRPSPAILRHPIARMEMILRPIESQYHFLQSGRVKTSR